VAPGSRPHVARTLLCLGAYGGGTVAHHLAFQSIGRDDEEALKRDHRVDKPIRTLWSYDFVEVGCGMSDMLAAARVNSGRFIVLECEHVKDVLGEQDFGKSDKRLNTC